MLNPEIGFWGGMALLISSITGPGLTTVPLLFQEAGWLLPVLVFVIIAILSASASLFLVEAMSHIRGNERFQAQVEFTTIAELCLGRRLHFILQGILYIALQSVNISSIIISCQSMDTILIQLFNKTCAISFTQGWISVVLVLPLSVLRLGQNIIFQLISAATLICIFFIWIATFFQHGLRNHVPVVGNNGSQLVGFIISNFAFVTTVPSFVNELSRKVSIHRVIGFPVIFCTILYIVLGILGASSYHIDSSSNIIATISSSKQGKVLHILSILINVLFPVSVLITSIPIFSIVIRYNLIRGNICSKVWALFWAAFFPWILVIPFQTMGWLNIIVNWTSLLFASSANYIIPFLLYFASKRYYSRLSSNRVEDGSVDVLSLQHLSPSKGSNLAESPNSAESHPEADSSAIDAPRNTTLGLSSERNESSLNERQDDSSNIAIHTLGSVSLGHSSHTPFPVQGHDDMLLESSASMSLEPSKDASNLHLNGGSNVLDSIDLERGPVIGIETSSTSGQDTERREDYSSHTHNEDRSTSIALRNPDQNEDRILTQRRHASVPSSLIERQESGRIPAEADSHVVENLFHAFPETRLFRSVTFATVGFLIMTLMVLGNLIYTIVETAKGPPQINR